MSERLPIFKGRVVDLGIEVAELPDGRTVELEVIRHPGAAAVVPWHGDGTITLVHQFRHAGGGMHYELPAGVLGPNEIPDDCAARELAEETGLRAGRLDLLGLVHTTPGFTDERIYLFLAQDLGEGEAHPEQDEHLRPVRLPLDEALALVDQGRLTDAKTLSGLLMLTRWLARGG